MTIGLGLAATRDVPTRSVARQRGAEVFMVRAVQGGQEDDDERSVMTS